MNDKELSADAEDTITSEKQKSERSMSLVLAMSPLILLVCGLTWNVYVFGDDALSGSSQLIILAASAYTVFISFLRGLPWEPQQKRIVTTIGVAMPSILILLLVGAMASIWLLCGTVPTLIYYGLKLLNPSIFLFACTIICAVTSLISGSSWSTAATIGVAMVGVGKALGIPEGLVGGAIISGSYFGDKVSPLSDTTNLASGVTETPVFEHIRYLFITTGPSMLISSILFMFIGFGYSGSAPVDVSIVLVQIDQTFNISAWLLLPPAIVLGLILRRTSAIPAMFIGIFMGVLAAVIFQPELLAKIASSAHSGSLYALISTTLYGGVSIPIENKMLSELFSSSGMGGMLNTIWLIIAAMAFGGAIEASGMLARIMNAIKASVSSFFSLIACTAGTCIATNLSTSDQYISVAMPGRMYVNLYKDMGYKSKNLSRTLEDTGTVTSVLIPWNTCGAYHASVLGIGTLTYLPYCFFNLFSPLMTLLVAFAFFKVAKIK